MSDLFNISKKVIVVSGATGVLGSAVCEYLAEQGAKLVILGRNEEKVSSLVQKIKNNNGEAFAAIADVTKIETLEKVNKQLKQQFQKIDVLINAAGGNMPNAVILPEQDFANSDVEAIQKVMELNYLGTYLPTKVFTPLLMEGEKGSIVNFSSVAASKPLTRVVGYSSAKAAIDNFTKWLAVEFAQKYGDGMRVNAVVPGFFLTEQNRTLLTDSSGNLTERGNKIINNTPMGRFGKPDELFGAIHWLCSDASKFVTGTLVEVDGGFNAYAGV
ncbi:MULTISPECIES: SDR family oxidoreductase [Flavobacteriaceae]|uniref:SDR family oxidoreductase n=1 Tax=Flavobacteriaceae TaxID=49546 RepID=UPI0014929728|nr:MULTISPECIES: SDR family oxidoreductase [Allomuricauda]MDC6367702.1 SDR family oxidoreductase [Muricauda sp. AC10]